MIVFIDESGDPGFKFDQGSSRFFTIALVVFEESQEAVACDQRLELLRREWGWQGEFHFYRNSDRVRRKFLEAVSPYNFFYYGIVIDKARVPSATWPDRHAFYKYTCGLVFENAKEKLHGATVVIDGSGSIDFRRELARYLKQQFNKADSDPAISKVKMQRSSGNNLLQLADYVAGVINRSVQGRKRLVDDYRTLISHREISVQIWPH